MAEKTLRERLSPEQRALPLIHSIDPGFVHHRRIETIIGPAVMKYVDQAIKELPELPDWQRRVRIDHIYTRDMLDWCRVSEVKTLGAVIASGEGRIVCSTERLGPCPDFYELERATNAWMPEGDYGVRVEFEYSTKFVASDTLKGYLRRGETVSIIAEHVRTRGDIVVFAPLVMGSPWLASDGRKLDFAPEWLAKDFYENYIEDVDEFARVVGTPEPDSPAPMEHISEQAFKYCLAMILGDAVRGDWKSATRPTTSAACSLPPTR